MKRCFLTALGSLLLAPGSFAIVDTNNNGVSDFWERAQNNGELFPATFDPQADSDSDGWTNAQEATAGTNPFDPNPPDGLIRPEIALIPAVLGEPDENGIPGLGSPQTVTVTWPILGGKQYTLLFSPDLTEGSWIPVGDPFIAYGGVCKYDFYEVSATDKCFWRVSVGDVDRDRDGLTDAEEFELGTSSLNPDTDGDGVLDAREVTLGTAPINPDTDGDGISDGEEIASGHDPISNQSFPPRWVCTSRYGTGAATPPFIRADWNPALLQTITAGNVTASSLAGYLATLPFPAAAPETSILPAGYFTIPGTAHGDGAEWGAGLTQTRCWLQTKPAMGFEIKRRVLRITTGYRESNGQAREEIPPVIENIEIVIPANSTQSLPIDLLPPFGSFPDPSVYEYITTRLLPMEVAVDADRDGEITFDAKDNTTAESPLRFWINNDQDDVEIDEPIIATTPDSYFQTIATKRDLEDFCRLKVHVGFSIEELRNGDFKIGLKFRSVPDENPRILVFANQSPVGNLDYLINENAAALQTTRTFFNGDIEHCSLIPESYWAERPDSNAHLIFEGVSKGTGELVVVIHDKDGHKIAESAGTWIKLLDVREMYRRARIVNEPEQIEDPWVNQNPAAQTWLWDDWDWPYSEDPDAEPVTAVLVHGWRLKYMDFMNWSDTSYKRLWHQGFKGKFYSFRWATFSGDNNGLPYGLDEALEGTKFPPGGTTYNASEYRAWLCGTALADFVNQLPDPPEKRNLFAHSMGNVIVGAALRNGMNIQNYALCNAAMAAMAYDPNPALKKDPNTGNELGNIFFGLDPHKTPDSDTDPLIRKFYGLQDKLYATNIPNKPTMFNFGLPDDSALGSWTANNLHFKPDGDGHSYYYQEIPQPPNLSYKLFQVPPNANPREVTSQPEAMGFVTKAITRTAGADLRTSGSIGASQNMNDWGPGSAHAGFGATHSAVWRWNNQSTHLFWEKLVEVLQLKPQQP